MRVLFITPYIYEPVGGKFIRNRGGVDLYVGVLAREVAKSHEVYAVTHAYGTGEEIGGIHYLPHHFRDTLSCLTPRRFFRAVHAFFQGHYSLKMRIRRAMFQVDAAYLDRCIRRLHPDVVHIHGCMSRIEEHVEACRACGVPVLITLHGLLGLDESSAKGTPLEALERELFQYADRNRVPLTVVSSGVKRRAIEGYQLKDGGNISVVLNGTEMAPVDPDRETLCRRYGLDPEKEILICVGSLCERKNQTAVLRAWDLMPEEARQRSQLAFVGREMDFGQLRAMAAQSKNAESVHLCGFVPPEDTRQLMALSKLNLFVSLSDGFGLIAIEGMSVGVPVVMYRELDAFDDIYDPCAVVPVDERSDGALADAMSQALSRSWDAQVICKWAAQFDLQATVTNYVRHYERLIEVAQ